MIRDASGDPPVHVSKIAIFFLLLLLAIPKRSGAYDSSCVLAAIAVPIRKTKTFDGIVVVKD